MYARALPQLQAERSLGRINEMMAVQGEDGPERQRYMRTLEMTANGGRESFAKPALNEDSAIAIGGSFFIPVETIE